MTCAPTQLDEVGLQVAGAEVDEADGDEGDDDPREHVQAALAPMPASMATLSEVGDGEAAQRDDDHGDDAQDGAAPVRVGEAREARELELARQVHEGAPAAQLLEVGAAAVRAVRRDGRRWPSGAASPRGRAGCAAGRRRARPTSTASRSQCLASASPNMRA